MIDNTTTGRALGFLVWFRGFYKGNCTDTYIQIAKNYGQCNYGTARIYILELEAQGYITVENRAKRSQRFIVNENKFQELIQ